MAYLATLPDESGQHRMLPTVWGGKLLQPDAAQHPRMEQDVANYLAQQQGGN